MQKLWYILINQILLKLWLKQNVISTPSHYTNKRIFKGMFGIAVLLYLKNIYISFLALNYYFLIVLMGWC